MQGLSASTTKLGANSLDNLTSVNVSEDAKQEMNTKKEVDTLSFANLLQQNLQQSMAQASEPEGIEKSQGEKRMLHQLLESSSKETKQEIALMNNNPIDLETVNELEREAKEKGINLQDSLLAQINPQAELMMTNLQVPVIQSSKVEEADTQMIEEQASALGGKSKQQFLKDNPISQTNPQALNQREAPKFGLHQAMDQVSNQTAIANISKNLASQELRSQSVDSQTFNVQRNDRSKDSAVLQLAQSETMQNADLIEQAGSMLNGKEKEGLSFNQQLNQAINLKETTATNINLQSINGVNLELTKSPQVGLDTQIHTPFGNANWNQSVNQKIIWMVGAGESSATLTLNPPDLGPLQVVLQVENNHVDTTFISQDAEVRQALQDGMQLLRDKMQEVGIQLGQANINSGQQSQREFTQNLPSAGRHTEKVPNQALEPSSSNMVKQVMSQGMVDTFA